MDIHGPIAVRLNKINKIEAVSFFYKYPQTQSYILINWKKMLVCWNYFPVVFFSIFVKFTHTYSFSGAALAWDFSHSNFLH